MKKFIFLFIFLSGILFVIGCNSDASIGNVVKDFDGEVTIYKSQSCGCCGLYSKYLESKGKLNINVVNMQDLSSIKTKYEVPSILESCHTTIIGDYFVEGHVPLEAIEKLMEEKPDIKGIGMPGMPSGSPGMPGAKNGYFTIYSVNKDGSQDVFMTL